MISIRRVATGLAGTALIAAGLTLTALPQPANASTLTISGKVTDQGTGGGIAGACITVGVPGNFCWTTTNATGDYFIDLGALAANSGQSWDIFFIKGGYTTTDQTVVVSGPTTLNLAMTANGQPISTTPPPPCATPPTPGCSLNPPPPVATGPTYTVYLPNITKTLGGTDGWHTPFIVQDVGTVSTSLTVNFYRFSDGSLAASHAATVLPGRSFVDEPNADTDLTDNTQYSVIVTSVGAPVVVVVNEHQGPGAGNEALSYSGITSGSAQVFLPLVSDQANGWLTTLIMQNLGTGSATIHATFKSLDGSLSATITKTAAPGQSTVIDPRFESALQAGVEYSAVVVADQQIGVVANNHHDLPGITPAMGDSYNGIDTTGAVAYLPYIAKNTDGVSRSSRVVVMNAGTAAATPTITLYPFGGGSPTNVPAISIPASGSFVFTPPTPDGEYSAVITGGTFVAVVATTSTLTAMYYPSMSAPQAKLYMPNVTRTLTLSPATDPGWTTPILLQSGGATSATLTWYRFSDGSEVTSQTVSLNQNVTTRVDPRTVTGLSDNTQYAVVLTTTGGSVVSLVTELDLVGGDDAMIYRGFAAPTP